MKCVCLLFLVIAAVCAEEKYSTENDDLDIEAVINDLDNLKHFTGCFMETSPCNEVSGDFKKDLPEAVKTACAKCTDKQKHILKRFLEGLEEKLPKEYVDFKKKYDPSDSHFGPLRAAIANF